MQTVLVEKEWQKFERDISSRHVVAHRSRGKPHPEPFRGVRLSWSRLFAFGGNTDLKSIVIIRPMCFYCVKFIHNFSWKIHASDRKSYFFNCQVFKIVFKEKKILEWFDNLRLFPKLRRESDRWQVNFNAATLSWGRKHRKPVSSHRWCTGVETYWSVESC